MSLGRQIEVLDVSSFLDTVSAKPKAAAPEMAVLPQTDARFEQMLAAASLWRIMWPSVNGTM